MAIAPQPCPDITPRPEGVSASMLAVCQAISSELEVQPLLDLILEVATRELRAQQGSVLLMEGENDELKMLATRGMPREMVERGYIPRRGSIAEWVIDNRQPVVLNDRVTEDSRFSAISDPREIRSSMCAPLQANGRVIGTLNITRVNSTENFGDDDLNLLQMIGSQAAIAIENARLHGELLQATRLATLGQTISGVSHCIKNILTGVKGGLSITEISFQEEDPELRDRGWSMLKRNIQRISVLVLDMLDFSKSRRPIRSPVSAQSLVDETFETLANRAEESQITLAADLSPSLPTLSVDTDQILRCLLNVVSNAIDASALGGQVAVRAIQLCPGETAYRMFGTDGVNAFVLLEVADSGCGIPQHLIEKIFDPFYSTKGSKGTGLGMPVTKKIIEEHGGSIEVDSQPGCGTTVRFLLPLIDGAETPSEEDLT